jgi:hypothetical protein
VLKEIETNHPRLNMVALLPILTHFVISR